MTASGGSSGNVHGRTRCGGSIAIIVAMVAIAGCGGGGDDAAATTVSPPASAAPVTEPATTVPATVAATTVPPTTEAAPTTPAPTTAPTLPPLGDLMTAADGFVTVGVPDGWNFEDVSSPGYHVANEEWRSNIDQLVQLVTDGAAVAVFREGSLAYAPPVDEWRQVVIDEVAPGFTTTAVGEGGVALLKEYRGRPTVLRTHPVDMQTPCVLTGSFGHSSRAGLRRSARFL